jgi:acetyl-CoA carboxylase carboxyl transferase subunit alpha
LWRSWDFKEQAAEALKLTAQDMTGFGLVDGIIKEPLGGAHTNIKWQSNEIKKVISKNLKELDTLSTEDRIAKRIEKFCNMGVVKG